MVQLVSTLVVASAALAQAVTAGATVDPSLRRAFRSSTTANIMITMNSGSAPTSIVSQLNQRSYDSRVSKISLLHDQLVDNAAQSQARVLEAIAQMSAPYESDVQVSSLWISNELYIPNASSDLIDRLADLPDIASIYQEHVIKVEKPMDLIESEIMTGRDADTVEWGVDKVEAPTVWASGNLGEGVLVGSIDTGVQGTHEALRNNFVGEYGWFDPYDGSPEPIDTNGHGTHTMGTIAGQTGIGVAPGSTWMACRGCNEDACTEYALKACGQFILCPTDVEGNNADCSRAPALSSNSWGGRGNDLWYKDIVDAWAAAEIVPIFAQGNEGPSCSSSGSPGDYANVIGVGATTIGDKLASFSSVGPARSGLVKPNIAAPGENVNSAWIGDDDSYRSISGTSMACPHVAGVVALMMSGHTDLTYNQIFKAMTVSATQDVLSGPRRNCGGADELTFPNNAFGYGVAHAPRALDSCDGSVYAPTPAPTSTVPVTCHFQVMSKTCHLKDDCEGFCLPDVFGLLCPEGCDEASN